MNKDNKTYFFATLYFVGGFLTWLSAGYIFNGGTANLIPLTSRVMRTVFHLSLGVSDTAFLLYTISDLFIVFIYVLILSIATGKKNLWIIMFIIGAIGLPLYHTVRNHIDFYTHDLPVWGTLITSITADCIIIPFLSWTGATLGNQYRTRKKA